MDILGVIEIIILAIIAIVSGTLLLIKDRNHKKGNN